MCGTLCDGRPWSSSGFRVMSSCRAGHGTDVTMLAWKDKCSPSRSGHESGLIGPSCASHPSLCSYAPPLPSAAPAHTFPSTRLPRRLHIQLSKPAAANVMLVKLIDQENMMQLYRDDHDWPNIDMGYVGLSGRAVTLPQGVSMRV